MHSRGSTAIKVRNKRLGQLGVFLTRRNLTGDEHTIAYHGESSGQTAGGAAWWQCRASLLTCGASTPSTFTAGARASVTGRIPCSVLT
jgi:hypothetical protein